MEGILEIGNSARFGNRAWAEWPRQAWCPGGGRRPESWRAVSSPPGRELKPTLRVAPCFPHLFLKAEVQLTDDIVWFDGYNVCAFDRCRNRFVITTPALANTSRCHVVTTPFWLGEGLRSGVRGTWSAISMSAMLCIRSPELSCLLVPTLSLKPHLPHFPAPAPGNHHALVCFSPPLCFLKVFSSNRKPI